MKLKPKSTFILIILIFVLSLLAFEIKNNRSLKNYIDSTVKAIQYDVTGDRASIVHDKMIEDHPNLVSKTYVQNFHYTNPMGFSNDVTTITPHYNSKNQVDYWEGYYIWTPYIKDGVSQEWYHFKSNNLSTFKAFDSKNPLSIKNIAIPKPNQEYKDYKSSSVVKNSNPKRMSWNNAIGGSSFANNTKKNGKSWFTKDQWGNKIDKNARIACFTGLTGTYKNEALSYLAYSNDGSQYRPISDTAAFSPSIVGLAKDADFRDAFVTTNKEKTELLAYVAGGNNNKVYILKSIDGKQWENTGKVIDFSKMNEQNRDNYSHSVVNLEKPCIESPYVTTISGHAIMFYGAQNLNDKVQSSVAYISGYFDDDGIFQINSQSKTGCVDQGYDFYGANVGTMNKDIAIMLAWVGNWNVDNSGHKGSLSLSRILSFSNNQLINTPVEPGRATNKKTYEVKSSDATKVGTNNKISLAFKKPQSSFHIEISRSEKDQVTIDFKNGKLTIERNNPVIGNRNYTSSFNTGTKNLSCVQFYVDKSIVEMYIPEIGKITTILSLNSDEKIKQYDLVVNQDCQVESYEFDTSKSQILLDYSSIQKEYDKLHDSFETNDSYSQKLITATDKLLKQFNQELKKLMLKK